MSTMIFEKIRQAGGTIAVVGGDLRIKAPKGLLTQADKAVLVERKAEIVKLLAAESVVEDQHANQRDGQQQHANRPQDQHGDQQDEVVVVPPCPKCGSFEAWKTVSGGWHCLRCDPPTAAIRALERVQQIRQRQGLPAQPTTAALLAGLRKMTSGGEGGTTPKREQNASVGV